MTTGERANSFCTRSSRDDIAGQNNSTRAIVVIDPTRPFDQKTPHVAARSDHRQAERILGAAAQHQRQRERRKRNADLLEDVADHAETEHQPDVEHRVLDGIGADRAGHDDHRRDSGERHAQDRGEDRHGGEHQDEADDVAEIHRRDQTPDEALVLDEQQRPGIEAPHHQAAEQDRRRAGAGDAEREHGQQRRGAGCVRGRLRRKHAFDAPLPKLSLSLAKRLARL